MRRFLLFIVMIGLVVFTKGQDPHSKGIEQMKLWYNPALKFDPDPATATGKKEHRIALLTAKETRFAKTEEIIRCESSNTYTTFYLVSGEKIIVSKSIYEFEELLADYQFIRCHQSRIVNKKYIKSWVKANGGYLLLYDKTEMPVSRQKGDGVRELF